MRKEKLFKNKTTKGLVAALALAMTVAAVPAVNVDAASQSLVLAKGDTDTLTASGAKIKKGSYKSNNDNVEVGKNGKVTAKKAGTATITAKTVKGKKVTYKVKVTKAPTLSSTSVSVKKGKSKSVSVNKNGAKYLTVSFKSSDTAVAKVSKSGKITGVKKGTATVTATVKGNSKTYKLSCTVKVKKADDEETNTDNTNTDTNTPATDNTNTDTNTPAADDATDTPAVDTTTGSAVDTTTGSAVDTTTGSAVDTTTPSSSGSSTTTSSQSGTAKVTVGRAAASFTVTIAETTELKITKSDLKNVYSEAADSFELPYTYAISGKTGTGKVPVSNNGNGLSYSGSTNVGSYIVEVTVAVKTLGLAEVTVKVNGVSNSDIVAKVDVETYTSDATTLTGNNSKAKVTLNGESLTITKDAAKKYVDGDTTTLTGTDGSNNPVTLTKSEGVTENTVAGATASNDICLGSTTLGGETVWLYVTNYKKSDNTTSVTVYAVSGGAKATITAE